MVLMQCTSVGVRAGMILAQAPDETCEFMILGWVAGLDEHGEHWNVCGLGFLQGLQYATAVSRPLVRGCTQGLVQWHERGHACPPV